MVVVTFKTNTIDFTGYHNLIKLPENQLLKSDTSKLHTNSGYINL